MIQKKIYCKSNSARSIIFGKIP